MDFVEDARGGGPREYRMEFRKGGRVCIPEQNTQRAVMACWRATNLMGGGMIEARFAW